MNITNTASDISLLALQGLSVHARGGKVLLDGVSLSVRAGECLAVIGPNGSGKSSLLRTLVGELSPSSGQMLFQGKPLAQMGRQSRAQAVALLAQNDVADARLSVAQYVALGRIPYAGQENDSQQEQIVAQALADTGMQHLQQRRLGQLSGGEMQRAALARALAQTPQLLLLDEPTNHLDPLARASLLGQVKRKGIAVIAVLHDLALVAPFADSVAVIAQGRLVRWGTPEQVLASDCIGSVFGMESFVIPHPRTGRPFHIFDVPPNVL